MKNKQIDYAKVGLKNELIHFTDSGIQRFVDSCIEDFPEYFWKAPASGTGKYHDEEENQEGGLVTHTRRVIRVVEELANFYALNFWETDILRAAAILHDSFCKGLNGKTENINTDVFHPLYVRFSFPFIGYAERFIDEKVYEEIMLCVEAHSGRWSVSKALNIDKKLPNIFKIADYIASRRSIKVQTDRMK